jgi:hypothetical protein
MKTKGKNILHHPELAKEYDRRFQGYKTGGISRMLLAAIKIGA